MPTGTETGTGSSPAYCAPKKASKKPGQVSAVIRCARPVRTRADQAAGRDLGALADLAPRQGRKNLTPDTIKGDPGLAPGRIVQHLRHRAKIGAPQGSWELRVGRVIGGGVS
jgi:hypothetical protein